MNDETAQASDHLQRALQVLRDNRARHPSKAGATDRRALAEAAVEEALALLSDRMIAPKRAARGGGITAPPRSSNDALQGGARNLGPNPSLRRAIAAVDVVVRTRGADAVDGAVHAHHDANPADTKAAHLGADRRANPPLTDEHQDLTRIRGITRPLAEALNRAGVTTYAQLAQWSAGDVKRFRDELGVGSAISRGVWIEQAALLAQRHPLPQPVAPVEGAGGGVSGDRDGDADADTDAAGGATPAEPAGSDGLAAAASAGLPITRIRRLNLAGFARSERRADVEVRPSQPDDAAGEGAAPGSETNGSEAAVVVADTVHAGPGSQSPQAALVADAQVAAPVGRWRAGEPIERAGTVRMGDPELKAAAVKGDRQTQAATGADDAVDDLQRIAGVSGFAARTLRSLGVTRFSQIADWTADDVRRHQRALGARARIVLDNWIEQAAMLAEGRPTRFEALYRHGVMSAVVVRPREVRWPARLGRADHTARDAGDIAGNVAEEATRLQPAPIADSQSGVAAGPSDVIATPLETHVIPASGDDEATASAAIVRPHARVEPPAHDVQADDVHASDALADDVTAQDIDVSDTLDVEPRVADSEPHANDAPPSVVAALPDLPPNRPAPSLEERISRLQAEIMQVRAFPASAMPTAEPHADADPAAGPLPDAEVDLGAEIEPPLNDDAVDADRDTPVALAVAPDVTSGDDAVVRDDDGPTLSGLRSDWFRQPAALRQAVTPPPIPDAAARLPETSVQLQDDDATAEPAPSTTEAARDVARLHIAVDGDFVTSADLTHGGAPDRAVPSAGSQPDNTHADVEIVYRTPGQDDSSLADGAVRPPPPDAHSDDGANEQMVERLADRLRRLRAARREAGEEAPAEPRRDYSIRPEEASVEIVARPLGGADGDVSARGHPGTDQLDDPRVSGAEGADISDSGSRRLRRVIDRHEAQGEARNTGLKRYLKALGGE